MPNSTEEPKNKERKEQMDVDELRNPEIRRKFKAELRKIENEDAKENLKDIEKS